jgi:hypothetical protein
MSTRSRLFLTHQLVSQEQESFTQLICPRHVLVTVAD